MNIAEIIKIQRCSPLLAFPNVSNTLAKTSLRAWEYKYDVTHLINDKLTWINEKNEGNGTARIGILLSRKNLPKNICDLLAWMHNESVNLYKHCQLSGGASILNYDREIIYSSTSCLSEDVWKIIPELIDAIYKEKENTLDNNEILIRKQEINKWLKKTNSEDNDVDIIFPIPEVKVKKLGVNVNCWNQYIRTHFAGSNENIIIMSGVNQAQVNNISLVLNQKWKSYLKESTWDTSNIISLSNQFDTRILSDNLSYTNIKLIIPSVPCSYMYTPSWYLLSELFGSASSFSTGGPGKGLFSRSYVDILRKKNSILSCSTINYLFRKNGFFGWQFTCYKNENETVHEIMNSLQYIKKTINYIELERAKNILSRKVILNLINTGHRLEDAAKSYYYYNKIIGKNYWQMINQIQVKDIQNAIDILIQNKSKSMWLIKGNKNNVKLIESREKIWQFL